MSKKIKKGAFIQGLEAEKILMTYCITRQDLTYDDIFDKHEYRQNDEGEILVTTVVHKPVEGYIYPERMVFPLLHIEEIFRNIDEVSTYRKSMRAILTIPIEGYHVLHGYTNDRPDFPNGLSDWKSSLSKHLGIGPDIPSGTLESLKIIDSQLKRKKISKKAFFDTLFASVLGYTGEVIRIYWGGIWHMEEAAKSKAIWEPNIELPNGDVISYFMFLYEMAEEHYKSFSSFTTAQWYTTDRGTPM